MTSRPGRRGISKIGRRLLAAAITLSMGYTFGVFTLGGCGGTQARFVSRAGGPLPEHVVQGLRECGERAPAPGEQVKHTVAFDVFMAPDGLVEHVALRSSTLHADEVEACMQRALGAFSERTADLSLRRREPAAPAFLPPEGRALLGNPVAIAVGAVEVALVVGFLVITVVVYYQVVRNTQTHRPPPPAVVEDPPKPEPPRPEPQTKVDPKTTDPPPPPPPPPPRRYPKQTCDDGELDRLEKEKKKLCYSGYAADCAQSRSAKMLGRIPCSAIKLSILQRRACLAARQIIQDKCFGGKPDAGHKQQIDDTQLGVDGCEAQKLINCAKGHPMGGL